MGVRELGERVRIDEGLGVSSYAHWMGFEMLDLSRYPASESSILNLVMEGLNVTAAFSSQDAPPALQFLCRS